MKKLLLPLTAILFIGVANIANAQVVNFIGQELLGRPTQSSIAINVVADQAIDAYFEYGTQPGTYTNQTNTISSPANEPIIVTLTALQSNTRYYYRMQYRRTGTTTWTARSEHSFMTQRPSGSSFKFDITSDSHVRVGGLGNAATWQQTLNNVGNDSPDFLIDCGDTFNMDTVTSQTSARNSYIFQRSATTFGLISHSVPLFLALGNHEEQEAWHLNDFGNPVNSQPVWGANAEKRYFLNPVPNGFYSGNSETYDPIDGDKLRGDYYAWTWGNALFIVIDPFWYTTAKPFTGNTGGGEPGSSDGDRWHWTLGDAQYNWLRQTLQNSTATFKFLFMHHMTGGTQDYIRGGAYAAPFCEWGGFNEDGTTYAFNTRRPGWPSTIHQMLVDNHVSAVFHGHDHQYAYESRDGVVYQSLPAAGFSGNGFSIYNESNPLTIRALPSGGHLRVTINADAAVVDYISSNAATNGQTLYSYSITNAAPDATPPTISITAPAAGNVSGTINVTVNATDNVGVVGAQFLLDGANLGAEDLSSPYSVSWNTTTASNGNHTLTARARDATGNMTTSSAIIVSVNNTIPDITFPSVSLTAPAAGNVSGTINVTADASDNIGVTGVQFLLDGANLGAEDLSSPYSVSWNTTTASNGNHTLTARARDATGNMTTSSAIIVSVNNTIHDITFPSVSLTAPAAGNVSGTINVTADASDNIGIAGVQFLLDGANLGAEDLSSPYSVSWNTTTASNGSHTLTARARDAAGNMTTSLAIVVSVNNTTPDITFPSVSLTAPTAGNVSGTINVTANASDNIGVAGVQFLLDGINLSVEDISSPYSVSWNTTTASNGNHTLTARARDAAGNMTTSTAIIVSVNNSIPSNTLALALPLNEGTGTAAADISGSNHPGTLTNGPVWAAGKYGQAVTLDGTNDYINIPDHNDFSLDPAQSYTWSAWIRNNSFKEWSTVWSQTLNTSNFFYFYAHTSTDADGGPVTNGISVYWWTGGGTNKLGVHSSNNVLTTGQWSHVTITYDASQPQNNRLSIYVNGADVTARTDVSSSGTLAAINPTNIRIGSNQLFGEYLSGSVDEVRYYKRLLTVAEIQTDMNTPLTLTPDLVNPTVNITAPAAGDVSGTINVTADASDNIGVAGVQFLLDGASLSVEDISSPFSVSWNTTTATNGNHSLTARARDAAGNTTTSSAVIVNVNNITDNTPPSVTITAPVAGNVSGTINVTANASDNIGVAGVQFLLDGVNLGAEDLNSPYSVSWNTITASNGNHTLTARARDAAGNMTTSTAIIVSVNNSIPSNTLVLALPLNEGTGTAAADISGSNHPGTLTNGPVWAAGKYGQAVTLDGTNDYINIPDHNDFSLDPAQSYTWSAWIRNNSFKEWSTVWSQTLNTSNFFYFYAHTSTDADGGPVTNGISVYWWTGGGTNKLGVHSSNNVLTTGQWSHVTITYDASQPQNNRLSIYVNGADVTARTDVSSSGTLAAINPTNIRIGSNQLFGEYLSGSVDEVRYYKRLLTVAEIQNDMNTPMAPAARMLTGTSSKSQQIEETAQQQNFDIKINPNPTTNYFNLLVTSDDIATVTIRVLDISGRELQRYEGTSNRQLQFGQGLKSGVYLIELIQKSRRKLVKVIKAK